MSDTFKVFLFTDRIFTNPPAKKIAFIYQFMSAIGYAIENIKQTSSDELFYIRWKQLSKYIYEDLVNIDKGVSEEIEKDSYYLKIVRDMIMDYQPSDELTIFIVSKLKNFLSTC